MARSKKSEKYKPTKEQFDDYRDIKGSGIVNMWQIKRVCEESETGITTDICLYIMDHYEELKKEYGY